MGQQRRRPRRTLSSIATRTEKARSDAGLSVVGELRLDYKVALVAVSALPAGTEDGQCGAHRHQRDQSKGERKGPVRPLCWRCSRTRRGWTGRDYWSGENCSRREKEGDSHTRGRGAEVAHGKDSVSHLGKALTGSVCRYLRALPLCDCPFEYGGLAGSTVLVYCAKCTGGEVKGELNDIEAGCRGRDRGPRNAEHGHGNRRSYVARLRGRERGAGGEQERDNHTRAGAGGVAHIENRARPETNRRAGLHRNAGLPQLPECEFAFDDGYEFGAAVRVKRRSRRWRELENLLDNLE